MPQSGCCRGSPRPRSRSPRPLLRDRAPGRGRPRRTRKALPPPPGRASSAAPAATSRRRRTSPRAASRVVVVGEVRRRGRASSRVHRPARRSASRAASAAGSSWRPARLASGSPLKSCAPPRPRRRPVMQTKPSTPRAFQVSSSGLVREATSSHARQKISRSAASPASPAGFGRSVEVADPDSSAPLGASNQTASAASPSSAPAAAMYLSLSIPTTPHVADPATRRHQAPGSSRTDPPNRRPASPTA